ncbi:MAG TPA: hypothetical protein VD772_06835 [Anseongella sp.]|nr:hypothetical protein [Anseongella sp.]
MLLAGMLAACQAQAQSKQKTFSKTYTVSADAQVSIDNQFGNVVIHSWDKNQVKADVNILVKHGNDSQAEQLLGTIQIIDNTAGDNISLRTSIGKAKLKGNASMQVNYDVYMPAGVHLRLVNKFGNSTLPSLKGGTDIRQSFGNLETGALTGNENLLFVEFSDASTRIGPVNNLEGDFRFSNIYVSGLTGRADIEAQHCGKFRLGAETGLSSLELDVQYSEVDIDLAENFSGNFNVSTNFGDFRYNERINLNQPAENKEDRGPRFKFNYAGNIGEGGQPMLNIDSNFSTVTFK